MLVVRYRGCGSYMSPTFGPRQRFGWFLFAALAFLAVGIAMSLFANYIGGLIFVVLGLFLLFLCGCNFMREELLKKENTRDQDTARKQGADLCLDETMDDDEDDEDYDKERGPPTLQTKLPIVVIGEWEPPELEKDID